MTPPPPPPAPPSPLCPLPLSRRPVCERGSPSLAAAAGHSGRSGAIPPSPQAGVTRTRQGKKKRCHHCGGFLRVAADNARALAWYFFLFFYLLPGQGEEETYETAPCCAESLSLLPFPPNGEKVSQFAFWWDPAVCGAISWGRGGEEGRKKKMGAFLLPHPWADDDDDDASPPHPSLPPSLFFLLLLRSVRTQRESLYTVSGFPSSPFFCFCCCLYLLPSLYLSCWSIVSLFFVFCA